jgi:hypothetical protein
MKIPLGGHEKLIWEFPFLKKQRTNSSVIGQICHGSLDGDEIQRFHHKLVSLNPLSNGNTHLKVCLSRNEMHLEHPLFVRLR